MHRTICDTVRQYLDPPLHSHQQLLATDMAYCAHCLLIRQHRCVAAALSRRPNVLVRSHNSGTFAPPPPSRRACCVGASLCQNAAGLLNDTGVEGTKDPAAAGGCAHLSLPIPRVARHAFPPFPCPRFALAAMDLAADQEGQRRSRPPPLRVCSGHGASRTNPTCPHQSTALHLYMRGSAKVPT